MNYKIRKLHSKFCKLTDVAEKYLQDIETSLDTIVTISSLLDGFCSGFNAGYKPNIELILEVSYEKLDGYGIITISLCNEMTEDLYLKTYYYSSDFVGYKHE